MDSGVPRYGNSTHTPFEASQRVQNPLPETGLPTIGVQLGGQSGLTTSPSGGRHRKCGAPERARLFKPSPHVHEGRETSLLPSSRPGIRYTIDSASDKRSKWHFRRASTATPDYGTGFSAPSGQTEDRGVSSTSLARGERFDNDPPAGSPTGTLLRLLFPLNDQVRASFRHVGSTLKPNRQPIRSPH